MGPADDAALSTRPVWILAGGYTLAMSNASVVSTQPQYTDHADLRDVNLPLEPNEASGMALVTDADLLDNLGWSIGFWVCLDEGPVETCVALVGHPAESRNPNEWEIRRLHGQVQNAADSTEDCEAIAVWDVWVYVFG